MEPRSSGFVKRLVIEILLVRIQVADICWIQMYCCLEIPKINEKTGDRQYLDTKGLYRMKDRERERERDSVLVTGCWVDKMRIYEAIMNEKMWDCAMEREFFCKLISHFVWSSLS